MSDKKTYRVKITEKHSDIVTVEAESEDEALNKAVGIAECGFESTYDAEVLSVEE